MAIPVRKQIYDFTGLPTRGCDDDFSTRKSRKLYNEKLKGMINMKNILKNSKKTVAGLVLTMMAVCMVSSVVYADSITRIGSRKKNSNGYYYSYTKVSAYDDRGFALNLKVGAKIGNGNWIYSSSSNSGEGTAVVRSTLSSAAGNAWHSYQIGSGDKVTWIQN